MEIGKNVLRGEQSATIPRFSPTSSAPSTSISPAPSPVASTPTQPGGDTMDTSEAVKLPTTAARKREAYSTQPISPSEARPANRQRMQSASPAAATHRVERYLMDSRRSTPTNPSYSSQPPTAEDPRQSIVTTMEREAVKNKPLGAYAHMRDPRDKTDVAQRLARTNTSVSGFTF